jgi:hypothetical protein
MKNSRWKMLNARIISGTLFIVFCFFSVKAQSTSQSYPTPIAAGEISGKIAARDLGDSRLTSYYYVFGGNQGDIFINVKTSNLDGDIDVFTADNLRPLTKIKVFSDIVTNETGRVIYLRKPEKLILRIEGRTPNDQPATFNLKFAGGFVPAQATAADVSPDLPEIKSENEGSVRVNSVGTIIEVKPTPKPVEIETQNESEKNRQAEQIAQDENTETNSNKTLARPPRKEPKKTPGKISKPVVVLTEDVIAEKRPETARARRKTSAAKNTGKLKTAGSTKNTGEKKTAKLPNPLENIRLIIEFKDGVKVERPMSEVSRVGVDKGVLILVTKDGKISRYSILDVAKMTIE